MTLEVAFLGYGFMGKAHANALARLPMFFPDAPTTNRDVLIGRNERAASEAAKRFGFDRIATDWRDVIGDVDVFYNLGPNHVHAEPTIAALESDVHVLCEKPLASTLANAEQMVEAAQASDAVAACAFNYRYVPALRLAKRLIDEGALGDIRHFRGEYMVDWQADAEDPWVWRNDAEKSGYGQVGDCGSHTIDLARWLVGEITGVSGRLTTMVDDRPAGNERREVTTDDAYAAIVSFGSGAQGVLEASRVATGHRATNAIEIIGTDGALRFDLERLNELEVFDTDGRGFERILVTDPNDPYMDTWWPAGHTIGWEHTVIHENYEFLTAIAENRAPETGFAEGLAAQEVVDAIGESHEHGEWIDR